MRNYMSCKTIDISTMKIKIFDGNVRTLKDVMHVLDLKKNIISLDVLDFIVFKFISENGMLKMSRVALVVMKNNMIGNLYELLGDMITCEVATITTFENLV